MSLLIVGVDNVIMTRAKCWCMLKCLSVALVSAALVISASHVRAHASFRPVPALREYPRFTRAAAEGGAAARIDVCREPSVRKRALRALDRATADIDLRWQHLGLDEHLLSELVDASVERGDGPWDAESARDSLTPRITRVLLRTARAVGDRPRRARLVLSYGGDSVPAGHDNHASDAYYAVLRGALTRAFALLGVDLVVRNQAQGNAATVPFALCIAEHLGRDADIVGWDFEKHANPRASLDVFARLASQLIPRAAVHALWSADASTIPTTFDARRRHLLSRLAEIRGHRDDPRMDVAGASVLHIYPPAVLLALNNRCGSARLLCGSKRLA